MTGRLDGKTAVITGGGRGIGRAIACAYAREGAAVVVAARSEGELKQVADEIVADGGRAAPCVTDITDPDEIARVRSVCESEFGPCDVLVNNAGIYKAKKFLDYTLEEFASILDVNVLGTVKVTREFLPGMLERGHGKIVNISSTAGKWGSLFQSPYNTSKHGLIGLTRCLALETAKAGVRVNAICPGVVATEIIDKQFLPEQAAQYGVDPEALLPAILERVPIGRVIDPDEVAHLAVYLGSNESDAVTGQSFTIAGGYLLI